MYIETITIDINREKINVNKFKMEKSQPNQSVVSMISGMFLQENSVSRHNAECQKKNEKYLHIFWKSVKIFGLILYSDWLRSES